MCLLQGKVPWLSQFHEVWVGPRVWSINFDGKPPIVVFLIYILLDTYISLIIFIFIFIKQDLFTTCTQINKVGWTTICFYWKNGIFSKRRWLTLSQIKVGSTMSFEMDWVMFSFVRRITTCGHLFYIIKEWMRNWLLKCLFEH